MKNKKSPFELYETLKQTYIDYIETQDFMNSQSATDERNELLNNEKSGLFQEPYLEPIIKYNFSGPLENDVQDNNFRDFLQFEDSLFPKNEKEPEKSYRFYTHQRDALNENLKHIVVTTGTGSGKTETFLLPIVRNLLKEATTEWGYMPNNIQKDRWKLLDNRKNSKKTKIAIKKGEFLQRYGEEKSRKAAIRAMILYPLNALVDDQLIRLRKLFNSEKAQNFMDEKCNGNRIYFGRYTGDTPISGTSPVTTDPTADIDSTKCKKLYDELKKIDENTHAEYYNGEFKQDNEKGKYFVQSLDGSEMYSRWDMQEYPPDILITNYSMLNIMLMRKVENNLFDKTKQWLEENKNHKFQLVIDELHSYRGTQGTEIAYLIREFLHRIGLEPDSPRLQILASTASLGGENDFDDKSSKQFLSEFFGVKNGDDFTILKGEIDIPQENPKCNLNNYNKYKTMSATDKEKALNDDNIVGFLKNAFYDRATKRYIAKPVSLIAKENNTDEKIIKALIEAITTSDLGKTNFPIRVHYLFKNFRGLWACTNPNCTESKKYIEQQKDKDKYKDDPRNFGKLYTEPKTICKCGSRILELLHCQVCGKTYFGGYTSEQNGKEDKLYLFPESANLERLPEFCDTEKTTKNYMVFSVDINSNESTKEDTINLKRYEKKTYNWNYSNFDDKTGKLNISSQIAEQNAHCEYYTTKEKGGWTALPFTCTHCLSSYNNTHSQEAKEYPIVKAYTHGAQKINQILIDALLREQEKRSIIAFTDSRQDAAKLSAGVEMDHYRDTLRQVAYKIIHDLNIEKEEEDKKQKKENEEKEELREFIKDMQNWSNLSPSEQNNLTKQLASHQNNPDWNSVYMHYALNIDNNVKEIIDNINNANNINNTICIYKFNEVRTKVQNGLLALGINPGGYTLNTYDEPTGEKDKEGINWKEIYNYTDNKYNHQNINADTDKHYAFKNNISRKLESELLDCIFGKKNGFEALGIGTVTFDRNKYIEKYKDIYSEENIQKKIQLIDSIIRIYGETKCYKGNYAKQGLHPIAKKYVAKFYNKNARACKDEYQYILEKLIEWNILKGSDTKEYYYLSPDSLYIKPFEIGDKYYQCTKCKRYSLHPANNICIEKNCIGGKIEEIKDLSETIKNNNFYYKLAQQEPEKLTSEELTAQISKDDQKDRQRRFQDIYIQKYNKKEYPIVDSIEMLSVTTTMEAGVDIGALEAVVMSNMPPQRFNYQQRVGRAGRRNQALAVALTVCRTRSHDEYYFKNPDKITNEIPPAPYLDLKSEEIFKRFLTKEVLKEALSQKNYNSENRDVHGEFGTVEDWSLNRGVVKEWMDDTKSQDKIKKIIESLSKKTQLPKNAESYLKIIKEELILKIDEAIDRFKNDFTQMGELLANAGLLPMFGFPTRERDLIIKGGQYNQIPDNNCVVSRDLDIAISQFAPCGETVKDKKIHMAVGIKSEQLNNNNTRKFVVCPKCKNLKELSGNDKIAAELGKYDTACEYCNEPTVDIIEAVQPDSFLTPGYFDNKYWKNRPINYDGNFEYSPYSHRPQINQAEIFKLDDKENGKQVDNFNCLKDAQLVQIVSINDNNGKSNDGSKIQFQFNKYIKSSKKEDTIEEPEDNTNEILIEPDDSFNNQNSAEEDSSKNVIWLSGDAIEKYKSEGGIFRTNFYENTQETKNVALISAKMTDVFLLEINHIPDDVNLEYDVNNIYSKSAYYSLAFLLRDVTAKHLDIDKKEIVVGLKTTKREHYGTTAQIFLSDAIENGAGYSKWLSEGKHIEEIIDKILSADYMSFYTNPEHSNNCDSSCYCCLQDYANLHYHGLLNWRLAYDMIYMMKDSNYKPSLHESYWESLALSALENLRAFIKSSLKISDANSNMIQEDKNTLSIRYVDKTFYLIHPLIKIEDTDDKIYINILDVIKRPNIVQEKIVGNNTNITQQTSQKPIQPTNISSPKKKKGPGGRPIKAKVNTGRLCDSAVEAFESLLNEQDSLKDFEKETIQKILITIKEKTNNGVFIETPYCGQVLEKDNITVIPTLYWSNSRVAFFISCDEETFDTMPNYNVWSYCSNNKEFNIEAFVKRIEE